MDAIIYIHGKEGSAAEAEHYRQLFPPCEIIGLEYKSSIPWDAGKEIHETIQKLIHNYDRIILIANSIGAYFSMNAAIEKYVAHAYFISPIVDMEKLITDMMGWAGITDLNLKQKGTIHTDFGEDLSWEYLCYVRKHPVRWSVPTDILYGSKDNLTSVDTIVAFAQAHHASLTIMDGGEHWFHTEEQIQFLDNWIRDHASEEMKTIMNNYIAYCGLDCETCDARIATMNNDDALRKKVAKHWSELNGVEITPEMINCVGCRINGAKTPYCESMCPIRQCASKRNVETCRECAEMNNCKKLGAILASSPEAYRNLKG